MATNKAMNIGDGTNTTVDVTINGSLSLKVLKAPTASNGTTLGTGTNGQVLKSNGSSVYWASDSAGTEWESF